MTPVVVGSMKALSSSASSLTMYYWGLQESQYCSTKGKKTVHDVKVRFCFWYYFWSCFFCVYLFVLLFVVEINNVHTF